MKSNIDYWLEVLKSLPESYKVWFAKEREYLRDKIALDSCVLEIGCGDGRSIFDLLQNTNNITGIDHDDNAVLNATDIFAEETAIRILKADAANLPFLDSSFDFVICMTTFANFADKKFIVLEEMKRVLKIDGQIIISVFSEDALDERMELYKSLGVPIKSVNNGTVTFDESLGDNISEQFSEKELREIFSKAELSIKEIKKVGIAYLCLLEK
jgi:ubiquinone/menaquinone biosynthesis C-methylase UbiE